MLWEIKSVLVAQTGTKLIKIFFIRLNGFGIIGLSFRLIRIAFELNNLSYKNKQVMIRGALPYYGSCSSRHLISKDGKL